jgi:ABC-type uncharacterized transport system permease subunit
MVAEEIKSAVVAFELVKPRVWLWSVIYRRITTTTSFSIPFTLLVNILITLPYCRRKYSSAGSKSTNARVA